MLDLELNQVDKNIANDEMLKVFGITYETFLDYMKRAESDNLSREEAQEITQVILSAGVIKLDDAITKLRKEHLISEKTGLHQTLTKLYYNLILTLKKPMLPKIVCLCGSTRFKEAYEKANYDFTMNGVIVLSVGCFQQELYGWGKAKPTVLDELHKRKIDLADEVFVINVDNYIGESTKSEIEYAINNGKPVTYLIECE